MRLLAEKPSKRRRYLFAYGALMNGAILRDRLGLQESSPELATLCRLRGWRRRWNFSPPMRYLRERGHGKLLMPTLGKGEGSATFLNIERAAGHSVLGIVFRLSDHEFDTLDAMEVPELMHRHDVTGDCEKLPHAGATVESHVATSESVRCNTALRQKAQALIPEYYYRLCYDSLASRGVSSHDMDFLNELCDLKVVAMDWR